jgi:hypothetical protein
MLIRKILLAVACIVALSVIVYFIIARPPAGIPYLKPGDRVQDFIVGMKSSTLYRLNDFIGKYIVVIAFSTDNENSIKFRKKAESAIKEFVLPESSIAWFSIEKDGIHAVINEITGESSGAYRTLYSNIPKFYCFSSYPSLIVVDKKGMINMVYTGYSPTIIADIKKAIEEIPQ